MRLTWLRLCTAALLLAMSAFAQTTPTARTSITTDPQQTSPVAQPSPATGEVGKPITDTLIYTIDPVTGKRIPVYLTTTPPQPTTPPDPPPSKSERKAALAARHSFFDDRYHIGVMASVGAAGAGIQVGIPLTPHFALRVGTDYARYNGSYQYDVANLTASLHAGYGRASLDYFPWRKRRFHISPLLIVANQTHALATVSIPSSTTFDLGGQSFYGSAADPLHGMGRVDMKRTAPGLTIGFGNLTHGRGHWTFPFEVGAFYNDTPKLQITFTGTACVANQSPQFACQRAADNVEFTSSLNAFRTRQQHNLTYARFMPIINSGIGFRF